jgi:hypothetical protein
MVDVDVVSRGLERLNGIGSKTYAACSPNLFSYLLAVDENVRLSQQHTEKLQRLFLQPLGAALLPQFARQQINPERTNTELTHSAYLAIQVSQLITARSGRV